MPALSSIGALIVGLASLAQFSTGWTISAAVTGILFLLASVSLAFSRHWYQGQIKERTDAVIEGRRAEHATLMRAQAAVIGHLVSVAGETSLPEKDRMAASSRAVLLATCARLLGDFSTRVTVFQAKERDGKMWFEADDMGHNRTEISTRTFHPGDETYEEAVAGRIRFQRDCGDQDRNGGRTYRTFMNAPILTNDGGFYGILAVDRVNPGDLDQRRDEPTLLYIAKLLALNMSLDRRFEPVHGFYREQPATAAEDMGEDFSPSDD